MTEQAAPDLVLSTKHARYLAVAFGGLRYPFAEDKKKTFMGMHVSIKDDGGVTKMDRCPVPSGR